MKKLLPLLILSLIGITSCEKLFIEPDPENTPISNFESMWKRLDEKYSFFEVKKLNWDSVHDVYRPKVYNGMKDDSLFKVLDAMLYTLQDGHVNMWSEFNTSRNWEWYLNHPQNFNRGVLERNYWGDDYLITGPLINQIFTKGPKKIGYIYYGSFSSGISDYSLDFVLNRMKYTDGLILDLRDNGGGLTTEVYKLLNRFVDQRVLVGRSYEKSGTGHNDFKLALEMYGEPAGDSKDPHVLYNDKPIVLLTNRSCYSSCTVFAGYMSVLPNVTIVGDQTGGGGGLPVSYQLPNGWYYRFSATKTELPDGFDIEAGIPVDVQQDMSPANEALGIDDILEKAFTLF